MKLSAFKTTIISFMSLNVRGLKNITKRKAIFLFCKDQKSQCVFLQETHSVMTDEKFWKIQWGITPSLHMEHHTQQES